MEKKTVSAIMLTLLLTSMLTLAFNIQPAQSVITPTLSAWAIITPTVDGALSPGEWDDAATEIFSLSTPEEHYCILYVKNDEQNLYFALTIKAEEFNPFPPEGGPCDYVSIQFDNDHDGFMWEVGDDCLFLRGDGGFIYDGFFRPDGGWGPDETYGGTNDIVGAVNHSNPTGIGDYTFECLHPLNTTDDAYDFSLSFGNIVGFQINYCDGASPGGYHSSWPETFCADIIIAKPKIIVPDDYPTIQEGINAASPGDIIYVYGPNYYPESVIVDKSVSLIGKFGPGLVSFYVVANYVYIKGFYFSSGGSFPYGRAIVLNGVSGCEISNVIVSGVDEGSGIVLTDASNNVIANSSVWGLIWGGGIVFERSSSNTIFGNTIEAYYGPSIYLDDSSDNKFFHNQFSVYEARQVEVIGRSKNVWDDGYPSGGNYWSDYIGVDVKSGPGQDLHGSDSIGDVPYIIDADNVDHYPLMSPYGAPPPPTYTLTITATAGGITDPAPGTYTYTANSTVQVTAIPNTGYLFEYWELDDANVGSANPYTVLMDENHTLKAVFSPIPPPLSASISPLSASILVGQSVTFTSTVSGGYTPYSYQWYLNGAPVSGANANSWAFTPTTSGIYYIHLKVTDAKENTAQSDTARITAATVPVGGYSVPIQVTTKAEPVLPYIALIVILTAIFTKLRPKTKIKH
jgi:parallel beta-helix repeat protein